ncbi:MAG TPA: acyl-ACP--UDP-N-acetylglucosamine O-acyltransferase [Phycisphaerales bacterium]|nr:acyl-ACP--UDP-N-acetylglucosamine O-acyltransferase [Phycisphaerales bacterium]
MPTVHPTSIIDPSAWLDEGVTIGPYCVIGPNVRIGSGTLLHNHVTIQRDSEIGRDNVLYPYAVVGGDPQDKKYRNEQTLLRMGDRNQVREMATIHRGTGNGGGVTSIGSDNLFMATAHVAHDCRIGDGVIIANAVMLAGHVHIEDYANIGGGAGLHHFVTVGTCAFVGGMARVPQDVPPYMLVEGSPAKPRKLNEVALTRRGLTAETIEALKDAYKRLYRDNGAAISDKIVDLRRQYAAISEICRLCDSLEASARGVHGRALESFRADNKRSSTTASPRPVIPMVTTTSTGSAMPVGR